jgi:hypothetical protein
MDDEAVGLAYWHVIYNAWQTQTRADLAELAAIKAANAGRKTYNPDEIVYIDQCTPAELKRLKTMTRAQIRALAKKQAKARQLKARRP